MNTKTKMNYYSKYLKYKEKYIQLKNELKGAGPKVPPKREFIGLRTKLFEHIYISKLGPKKIVATPNSGYEFNEFKNMWDALDEENKFFLTEYLYPKQFGFKLGVYIKNPPPTNGNQIIFYAVEYLDLLAKVSSKTTDELLEIFSIAQLDNPYNFDLIKIAFGDIFGNGVDERPLETIEGQKVLQDYLEYLDQIVINKI